VVAINYLLTGSDKETTQMTIITSPLLFQPVSRALAIHGEQGEDRAAAVTHIARNIKATFGQDVQAEELPRVVILRCDGWGEAEWRGILRLMEVEAAA